MFHVEHLPFSFLNYGLRKELSLWLLKLINENLFS